MKTPPFPTCGECRRYESALRVVPPEVLEGGNPEGPSLVIVGQDPGKQEEEQGRPWVGPSGRYVRAFIDTFSRMFSKIYLTNACLCRSGEAPTKTEIECCKPNLDSVISEASSGGKVEIIACGRIAESALKGYHYTYVPHPSSYLRVGQGVQRWTVHVRSKLKVAQSFPDIIVQEYSGQAITSDIVSVDAEFTDMNNPFLVSVYDGEKCLYFTREKLHALPRILPGKIIVAHNAVVEAYILHSLGLPVRACSWIDTLSLVRAYDDSMVADLKSLAGYVFGYSYDRPKDLRKGEVNSDIILYNARDSYVCYKLYKMLTSLRDYTPLLSSLGDLVPSLVEMGSRGIRIDHRAVESKIAEYTRERDRVLRELKSERSINWDSPLQVNRYFESIGYKTSSVDKTFLQSIDHPVAKLLLEYRKYSKLINTFLKPLENADRCRFLLNPSGTETGRLSFLDGTVNVQTIPDELRGCFVPDEGHVWLKADFKTHEVRVLAWLAETPVWRDNVADWNEEPTPITDLLEAGDPYDQLSYLYEFEDPKLRRDLTKMTFLALMYGAGPKRIYEQATKMGAKAPYDKIKEAVEGLKARIVSIDRLRRYVDMRSRYLGGNATPLLTWPPLWRARRFDLRMADYRAREEYEKALINTPVQGAAADICTLAALEISKKYQLLNIVHDEVDIQVHKEELDNNCLHFINHCMLRGWSERIPEKYRPDVLPSLAVDFKWGESWAL